MGIAWISVFFCRSWLASDGGLQNDARLAAAIAGKPAPTVNVWIPGDRKSMGIAW
ncbi:hypothetical protein QF012_006010, partial [Pseudomonas laurylsulfatiphila]